ncbi:MAG: general secretion pathway protein GspM [Chromatiaceae bacterium]|nr:MAG: general secretion pathway protein GspM [Chromatiaceae bacterium]
MRLPSIRRPTLNLGVQQRRCVLVWTATLLLPLVLLLLVLLPWWQQRADLQNRLQTATEQWQRFQRVLATLPALREELAREQANEPDKAFYFDAATPALAGAQLQREVQEIIRASGARPISAQALPAEREESPARVRLRVQLQGSTEQLFEVLYRIEDMRPFLFVDQLSIRSTPQRPGVRRPRVPGQQDGELTVRIDVFGFVLSPGA